MDPIIKIPASGLLLAHSGLMMASKWLPADCLLTAHLLHSSDLLPLLPAVYFFSYFLLPFNCYENPNDGFLLIACCLLICLIPLICFPCHLLSASLVISCCHLSATSLQLDSKWLPADFLLPAHLPHSSDLLYVLPAVRFITYFLLPINCCLLPWLQSAICLLLVTCSFL